MAAFLVAVIVIACVIAYASRQPIAKHKKTFALVCGGLLLALVALVTILLLGAMDAYKVRGGTDVSHNEVLFLDLPPTVKQIDYFSDGVHKLAEFGVSETEFRTIFSDFQMEEIRSGVVLRAGGYGSAKEFPPHSPESRSITVSNGLKFETHQSNGGGYAIYFDRNNCRAYYRYSSR